MRSRPRHARRGATRDKHGAQVGKPTPRQRATHLWRYFQGPSCLVHFVDSVKVVPMELAALIDSLATQLPPAMRWAGSVARRMRGFNIALENKHSGSANTDALTLADLTVQELLVGALRDGDPLFRRCRIEAEESTGDLARFATDGELTLALDPIDGTKQYRDKTGNGYSIILTLRSRETVHFTLVFVPESGPCGSWVFAAGERILCGADDPERPATEVLRSMKPRPLPLKPASKKIYLIGFQQQIGRAH